MVYAYHLSLGAVNQLVQVISFLTGFAVTLFTYNFPIHFFLPNARRAQRYTRRNWVLWMISVVILPIILYLNWYLKNAIKEGRINY